MSTGEVLWDALEPVAGAVVDTTDLAGLQPTDEGGSRRLKGIPALNVFDYMKTKFGTAAQSDAQTSLIDATADRLLKVGAFGLGKGPSLIYGSDYNDYITPGFYFLANNSLNQPAVDAHLVHVISGSVVSNDRVVQIAYGYAGAAPKVFRRTYTGTAWTAWAEYLNTSSYPSDSAETIATSLDNGWTGTVVYSLRVGWVSVSFDLNGSSKTSNVILTLPSRYRPSTQKYAAGDDNGNSVDWQISTLGVLASGAVSPVYRGSMAYPIF